MLGKYVRYINLVCVGPSFALLYTSAVATNVIHIYTVHVLC